MAGAMDYLMGFRGERVLVNGQLDASIDVATRAYRLRLLNASNARTYKLAWADGTPLTVIASDGGLLERPLTRPCMTLAPGERVELWADFRGRAVGSELNLASIAQRPPAAGTAGTIWAGRAAATIWPR
jgi:blue copper oxidase